jgi:catechol 2,3-dioxygenase-like lactoylglutathione lyase family enzyme
MASMRIDHIVLTVASIQATSDFYSRALGLEVVTFDGERRAIQVGKQKLNLHEAGHELEPKARRPTPGSVDICLVTEEPLVQVVDRLAAIGVAVELGPVGRTGAIGPLSSIYVRDPDGNLVEIANQLEPERRALDSSP